MDNKEMSFDRLPEAVSYVIEKIEKIEQAVACLLDKSEHPNPPIDKWMNVNELIDYLPDKPAKPTVYSWVWERKIPHHKGGKKLRFLKSEIDEWLSSGKRKSEMELEAEAAKYLTQKGKAVKK
jgi:excisionase family DNA binding protein